MKKLIKRDEIIHSDFGNKGMQFYTTNCKNCPFGTNYDSCRRESISYIMNFMNKQFGIKGDKKIFEEIEYNQSLLHIKEILKYALKDKTPKMETATLTALSGIYFAGLLNLRNQEISNSPKKRYYNINHIIEKMPLSTLAGFVLGQHNGSTLMLTYFNEILTPYLSKRQIKEIHERAMSEYSKISSALKSQ